MSKQWTDTELAEWEAALEKAVTQPKRVYDFTASAALAYAQSHMSYAQTKGLVDNMVIRMSERMAAEIRTSQVQSHEVHIKAHREAVMQLNIISVVPSSFVAQTKAGKIQAISDMVRAGMIHGDAAYQMLWEDDEVKLEHVPYHIGMDWGGPDKGVIIHKNNDPIIRLQPYNASAFVKGDIIERNGRVGKVREMNYFDNSYKIDWEDSVISIDNYWYDNEELEHAKADATEKELVQYRVGDKVVCNDGAVKNAPGKIVGYNDPFYMVNLDSGTPNVPFYARELSPLAGGSNTGLNAKCRHPSTRGSYVLIMGKKVDFKVCTCCGEEVK